MASTPRDEVIIPSDAATDKEIYGDVDIKEAVEHVEDKNAGNISVLDGAVAAEIELLRSMSPEDFAIEERKLLRKIDFTLLPTLFVLLILNYLDRNALASARVQGIEKSLGLVGTQFNTAISLLFVGYILGQIPSNLILSRTRPSIYLSVCVMVWAIVSLCTGFVKNYHQLLAVRILLGFTESPYFPGALFLLSTWYTKKELAYRTAFLYTGSLLSGAFSGLIAAGVQNGLDGKLGMESWRWLFILEGAITGFAAIIAMFVLPDYPATTKWLSTREKAVAVWRMERDVGSRDEDDQGLIHSLKLALCDYRLYLLATVIITKTTAGAVTQFFPTVIATFGFNKVITLLLLALPYLVTAVLSLLISRLSDRKPERCFHLALPLTVGMIGYIIAVSTLKTGPRYFSLFLMLGGLFGSYNVALAWISSTFPRPRAKRAAAYAIINSLGNIAQIWSPYLYPSIDAPRYTTAFATNSAMAAVAILFCFVLRFFLKMGNAKMDREDAEAEARGEAVEDRVRYVL
ncbi:nicotinamide mononucleotide permease [Cryptococcus neoformans c45]|nr:nicotinamide mononucleotide permease [Cryptococcus neoformans var. grubii c45]